jgi:hypothetical protein
MKTNVSNTRDTLNDKNYSWPNKKVQTEIIVKNKADYSEKFIQGLKKLGFKKIELKDSLIIINDSDTSYFPGCPSIGKYMVLTGRKDDLEIALTIERKNYTTLDYKIEMVEFGKARHSQSGQADLNSGFFFGAESDISMKSGNAYLVTEFVEYQKNDCYTFIRLGYDEETGPYLLGKLKKNCNDKLLDINLENFTTLIEK